MTTDVTPAAGATDGGSAGPVSWILWAGTADLFGDLETRVEVAAAGPYEWVSLSALDLATESRRGRSAAEVGERVRRDGLRVVFDPLVGWHPTSEPSESPFAAIGLEESLRGAAEVGAELVSVVASPHGTLDHAGMVDAFAVVSDRIAAFGAEAQLEFIPWTAVPDLRTAWDIVIEADRASAGVLVDSWHFFRSDPDFDLLASIDGSRVSSVQLDDGEMLAAPGTRAETMNRALPGEGDFDLDRFLRALADIGALRRVGAEVITPAHRAMPVAEAAARSHHSVLGAMRSAGLIC
jgi:sugar phosphate isomerase/epimerase